MSRRSLLIALAVVVVLIGGGGGLLFALLHYEQPWYVNAHVPPGAERKKLSVDCVHELNDLYDSVRNAEKWGATFSDEQLNSYFEEFFVQSGLNTRVLPENVSNPRIAFEPDRARLAFRYNSGGWSTVISIDLIVYLLRNEPNAVVLELEGLHAGALPFSAQSLLERISESEVGLQNGVEIGWYRHPDNGHPVAVVRFQANQTNNSFRLESLQLEKGSIKFSGRSGDLSALRTMLTIPGLKFDWTN
jgi:hypothetical protein